MGKTPPYQLPNCRSEELQFSETILFHDIRSGSTPVITADAPSWVFDIGLRSLVSESMD